MVSTLLLFLLQEKKQTNRHNRPFRGSENLFILIKSLPAFAAMQSGNYFLLLYPAWPEFGILVKLFVHRRSHGKIGVNTDKVHEPECAHFKPGTFKQLIDRLERARILFKQFEAFHVIMAGHAVYDEAG